MYGLTDLLNTIVINPDWQIEFKKLEEEVWREYWI